jgi:hypothetical protein
MASLALNASVLAFQVLSTTVTEFVRHMRHAVMGGD